MKVVINKCFGGFGVSNLVVKELTQSSSDAVKSYTPKYYYGGDNEKYKQGDWDEKFNDDFPSDFYDIGDGFYGHKYNYHIYKEGLFYDLIDDYQDRYKIRSHPDLIKAVERLGDSANGSHAELSVVEIPDGIEYEIDEYDGIEHIAEKHRTWS